MKQRHVNVTLTIVTLALTVLPILTIPPLSSTTASLPDPALTPTDPLARSASVDGLTWDGTILQLTDNDIDDGDPQIDNGQVVWHGGYGLSGHEIYLWDGTTRQLSDGNTADCSPQIDDSQVVWCAFDGRYPNRDIFFWDSTIQRLTDDEYNDLNPYVHAGQVSWVGSDGHDYEIFLWDGSTTHQLTDNEYPDGTYGIPQIDNGQVVWEGWDGHDNEIFLWDGSTTYQLTDNDYDDRIPQIDNSQVVWVGSDGHDYEVFLWDGSTTHQLTDNEYWDSIGGIDNGQVVWYGEAGIYTEIFLWDGSTIHQLTDNGYPDNNPQIDNGQVVWSGWDGHDYEIFLWDGGTTHQLTDNDYRDELPKIDNGQAVWEGYDGHDLEIFLWVETRRPPVVLVHGWQGLGIPGIHGNTCTITPILVYRDPETNRFNNRFLGNLPQWLCDLGYTEIYEVNLTTGPGHTPRFEENAECLRRQLESVTGGTRKAILIAHSMGGLVSRAYMENENLYRNDVVRIITLGSPHTGINFEFLLKFLLGLKAPEAVAAYCFVDPGTCQLSMEQVGLFNLAHNSRALGVPYNFIGGTNSGDRWPWLIRQVLQVTEGPNDGLVGVYSATGRFWPVGLKVVDGQFVSRYQTNETHSPGVGHPHYFEGDAGETRSCIRYLLGGSDTGGSCVQATAMMAQAQAPAIAYSLDVCGHITSTQTITHSLQVDADGASLFYLSWVTGTLGITLTNPVGTVIDPAYAAANTDVVTYTTSTGSEMTPPFAAYAFTTTVSGLYTATITADDVGTTGTDYLLFAAMETTRTLSVALDSDHYQIGDTAVLTATMEGAGGGITGATVQATFSRSDAITDTLTLTDQGDGTYRGTYVIPNAPGYLHLRVTAEGSDAGTQFNRQVDRLLTVASQAVQLTGTYADRADDADGDGRYETLTVDVEVLAAGAGDFTFSADLVTGGDQFVAHVITPTALITGTQSVPLSFDGELIQEGGSDRPFTVTNLLISDPQNAGIPSVMADDVWTTAAYDHTQFGRITGDMNGDCIVTVVDIMLVASRWGTHIGDIRYDVAYDLDDSGDIDIADIMFVAAHWRERCE